MVPWDICTMAKDKYYLGLIDLETQGNILATKKVSSMCGGLLSFDGFDGVHVTYDIECW